jgi:hypothetical protein
VTDAPTAPTLSELQALFYRLVTAPEGVAAALAGDEGIADLVVGDERLSTVARLDVYASMYFHRLRDVLRTDYPKLVALLGDAAFHDMVAGYLVAHPPSHPSVRELGLHLSTFLATREGPLPAGLAALERARLEVFDAADSATLDLPWLQALPPERFASLELRLVRAHRVLTLGMVVGRACRAIDEGVRLADAIQDGDDEAHTWIVWRGRDPMIVHHRALNSLEASLLPLLAEGAPFAQVCERLGETRADEEAVRLAAQWLSRWAEQGLLAAPG